MNHRHLIWLIPLLACAGAPRLAAATFSADVAPVLFEHCAGCHRPGQAAPFSLTNYEEIRKRGRQIGEVVGDRLMPPWKMDRGEYPFRHDRRLTDAEIALIQSWVREGMPEGDPSRVPDLPEFPDEWPLGRPDLILQMPAAFSVPAEGRDIYRNFVLPLSLPEDQWIRAIDFRPGARSVVHHSLFYFDATGTARALDGQDGQPGYGNRMGPQRKRGGRVEAGFAGDNPEDAEFGSLGGWALGGNARVLPDGLAMRLPKGADFILSTHFHPSGKAEAERSTVGIYFAEGPPEQSHTGIQLPPLFGAVAGIDIPAGDANYRVTDSFVLPVDVKAFGITAHAHYLAKIMTMTATFPNGASRILGGISDWDFAWQEQYLFEEFVELPKGTRLDVELVYDNSDANPNNPSHPPRRVKWGEQSTDEMGSMTLLVIPASRPELTRLKLAGRAHLRESVAGRIRERFSETDGGPNPLDKNGDGRIERDELPARQRGMFDRLDANQNGQLDPAELRELQRLFRGALEETQ